MPVGPLNNSFINQDPFSFIGCVLTQGSSRDRDLKFAASLRKDAKKEGVERDLTEKIEQLGKILNKLQVAQAFAYRSVDTKEWKQIDRGLYDLLCEGVNAALKRTFAQQSPEPSSAVTYEPLECNEDVSSIENDPTVVVRAEIEEGISLIEKLILELDDIGRTKCYSSLLQWGKLSSRKLQEELRKRMQGWTTLQMRDFDKYTSRKFTPKDSKLAVPVNKVIEPLIWAINSYNLTSKERLQIAMSLSNLGANSTRATGFLNPTYLEDFFKCFKSFYLSKEEKLNFAVYWVNFVYCPCNEEDLQYIDRFKFTDIKDEKTFALRLAEVDPENLDKCISKFTLIGEKTRAKLAFSYAKAIKKCRGNSTEAKEDLENFLATIREFKLSDAYRAEAIYFAFSESWPCEYTSVAFSALSPALKEAMVHYLISHDPQMLADYFKCFNVSDEKRKVELISSYANFLKNQPIKEGEADLNSLFAFKVLDLVILENTAQDCAKRYFPDEKAGALVSFYLTGIYLKVFREEDVIEKVKKAIQEYPRFAGERAMQRIESLPEFLSAKSQEEIRQLCSNKKK